MKFFSPSVRLPRVKLVAIAKDEAAYIPEWVFHHFYFGVDSIDIYINRIMDNTVRVLDSLKKIYPKLNYFSADWVDSMPAEVSSRIQYVCYGLALGKARQDQDCDYILYLDIDEFFASEDFSAKIPELLLQLEQPDCVCFQWFNETGSDSEFSAINKTIRGHRHSLVKSIVKVDADIARVSFHTPRLKSGKILLADGEEFKADGKRLSVLNKKLNKQRSHFIIHRLFRSRMEYCAALVKGNAERYTSIKTNRNGYNSYPDDASYEITFAEKAFKPYTKELKALMANKKLAAEVKNARTFISARAKNTMRAALNTRLSNIRAVYDALRDTEFEQEFTNNTYELPAVKRCKDKFEIVKAALDLEKSSIEASLGLWKRANEINPSGPLIKKKCEQYKIS